MKKENKEKWIAALESGKYKQTTGGLCNRGGFCCLGVYADAVMGVEWEDDECAPDEADEDAYNGPHKFFRTVDGRWQTCNLRGLEGHSGISREIQEFLMPRNDGIYAGENPDREKWTFKQIAQWIRENVEVTDDVQA